jgi:protoporphyrinogen/coproporphyrinogen III oxidase
VTSHVPALVIGAGISGLVCAYALRKAGVDALIIESSPRPGGVIHSERRDGYLLEFGPQSFNATDAVLDLCSELEIDNLLLRASARAPRFVLVNGELRAVPLSPPAFLASSLFSTGTKLKVLRDALGRSTPPQNDESVAAFVRRKFSAELLEKFVGPFVSGIYAGDPERLSLRSAFPQLYEAEKSAGAVVRGLLRGTRHRDKPREKPSLQTFHDGNQTLIDALAANLGGNLRCGMEARRIGRAPLYAKSAGFELTILASGREETLLADCVIVATPAQQAGAFLRELDPQFESTLEQIEYAPVAVVALGYRKTAIRHSLDGFGFLVPRSSGLRILGTVWNSSLFPGRAPDGHELLTSFVGGATDLEATRLPESQLIDTVHRELARVLGISQEPSFSSVWTYDRGIPQFNTGHGERIALLSEVLAKHRGLYLAGNYLRGPALGTCIEQALTAAQQAGKN